MFEFDVCTIGSCGRVGLPLSIAFAAKGLKVALYDIDGKKIDLVNKGMMPFLEEGCEERLRKVIGDSLIIEQNPVVISKSKFVIVTIGTPVEEHLNPQYPAMKNFFVSIMPYLVHGQYLILRSTVYPGTAEKINELLKESGLQVYLTFCPERIAEGKALEELENLPQIVSGFEEEAVREVAGLFRALTKDIIITNPIEAELAKLFTNVWRYIQFSTANQFFMIANDYGLDTYRIFEAMTYKYPRTQGLPRPGFTAGPCLFKDTMQLAAFNNNNFFLGHAAMLINEGLPNYIGQKLKEKTDLKNKRVGILGMAFKANCDDDRDSLAYKLKRILEIEAKEVYCTDIYIKKDYFIRAEDMIKLCDVLILAAPHKEYQNLEIDHEKILVDVWNFYGRGGVF